MKISLKTANSLLICMLAACGVAIRRAHAGLVVRFKAFAIELIQGSWRGNLTERPRECLGMNDSQAPIAKSAIHKITIDAGKISVQDEVGQIYRGLLSWNRFRCIMGDFFGLDSGRKLFVLSQSQ